MKLTIGSTTFAATKCERRRDTNKGFFLDIAIPAENISKDELYSLLDGNTETIIVTEDDGTESEYSGFNSIGDFSVRKGSILVAQYCTSELEAQLSLAKNKITEQTKTIAALQTEAAAQANEILAQAEVIVAQGETVAGQGEIIESQAQEILSQAEVIVAQGETIASMIEEIPAMITAQVDAAVAAALENSTTAEGEE